MEEDRQQAERLARSSFPGERQGAAPGEPGTGGEPAGRRSSAGAGKSGERSPPPAPPPSLEPEGLHVGELRPIGVGRIEPYEEAFSQIRSATGSSDIDALVEAFIAKEDANFKAYNYLNALAAEVERSEEAVAALHGEAESFRGADRGASSQRRRLVTELSDQAAEGEAKAEQLSESSRKLSGAISSICKIAHRLVGRTCSDRDLNKIGGCDENSLMLFMGMIEHAANETLGPAALDASAGAPRGGPSAKAVTSTMVLSAERLHSDSDEEAGVPLSRNELQLRTMRGIERREAKPAASRRGSEAGHQRRSQPKEHR